MYFSAQKLFICSLLLLASHTEAQSFIKGKITDSLQQTALPYAIVGIYHNDSLLHAILSDSLGDFVSQPLHQGTYHLKVDAMGYHLKKSADIVLEAQTTKDIGSIQVVENITTLEQVVIKDQGQDQIKIDKQIYKAAQFEAAKGGTAIDVLKNMPSVTVNAEGEIRLRGSTGFLVLINGKAVLTDVNTVLSQIPANSVENIEIITAPSAKYDADGKSGIINITTKKGSDDGFSFTANVQYGLPSLDHYDNKEKPVRYGSDVSLNYKKKQLELSLGASYQRNDLAGYRDGDVNTTVANIYNSFPSQGERSFKRKNYALRGYSYLYIPQKQHPHCGLLHGPKATVSPRRHYLSNQQNRSTNQSATEQGILFQLKPRQKTRTVFLGQLGLQPYIFQQIGTNSLHFVRIRCFRRLYPQSKRRPK